MLCYAARMNIMPVIEKAGGISKLARELGLTHACVHQWVNGTRSVPIRQWVRIGSRWPDLAPMHEIQALAEADEPNANAKSAS